MTLGKVFLVGAGPGDPGLVTQKGKRCIESADVIVYDRLVSPRLLAMARPDAQLYYVGKASAAHTMKQEEINHLLVRLASEGRTVVRLKGGDPFVFGRGGEEALALTEAHIAWQVVPGVSSAVSVPAYAGIPVTHRNVASSFTVVTGHRCREAMGVDWEPLAKRDGTLVILMGVDQLPAIVEALTRFGKPVQTPVALVRWGTLSEQRTLIGTLNDIVQRVTSENFQSPACIIIGDVVDLSDDLSWFEQLPLFGNRVLLAADSTHEASQMAEAVEALGAETLTLSLEQFARPVTEQIEYAVQSFRSEHSRYRSILFTSAIGVQMFFEHLWRSGEDARSLARVRFGAANHAVAVALKRYGVRADVIGGPAAAFASQRFSGLHDLPTPVLIEMPHSEFRQDGNSKPEPLCGDVVSLFSLDFDNDFTEVVQSWVSKECNVVWAQSQLAGDLASKFLDCETVVSDDVADVERRIVGRPFLSEAGAYA